MSDINDHVAAPDIPDEFAEIGGLEPAGETGDTGEQNPFPTGQPGFEPGTYEVEGTLNSAEAFQQIDSNSDGIVDGFAIDTNGDGLTDLGIYKVGDQYWITSDLTDDGYSEGDMNLSSEQMQLMWPDLWAALNAPPAEGESDAQTFPPDYTDGDETVPEPVWDDDGNLTGDPDDWAAVWFHQSYQNSCVPTSIAQIFDLYSGQSINEEAFVQMATEQNMWSQIGTTGIPGLDPWDAQSLLQQAGIPATVNTLESSGLSLDQYFGNLQAEIDSGTGVMVMVDSSESVGQDVDGDTTSATDHAVLVTGIDFDRGIVTLNDPDRDNGANLEITLADFEDAWADSGYAELVCDQSADEFQAANGIVPAEAAGTDLPAADLAVGPAAPVADVTTPAVPIDDLLGQLSEQPAYRGIDQLQPSIGDQIVSQISRHGWILLPVAFAIGSASKGLVAKRASGA
ncbi:C39 family peptidase [Leifsonia sp. Leaf264]|uniref:C39 family peptidase n=1 Tax=Leifsonia sp. Leaf264 TaxID=1736314 RepID=UPI0006F97EA6|nr:C39 family peptidase [Leifsonia sp. Leaf264]KQO98486.1 hypothetical protein ASF30_10515 [Leifsonia sp. Leaf264]